MPKIKTIKEYLDNGSTKAFVEFEVHYSTTLGFFGRIPENFFETTLMLSEEEAKGCVINRHYKWDQTSKIKSIHVNGKTEDEATENTKKFISKLLNLKTTRRSVILVYFTPANDYTDVKRHPFYRSDNKQNEQHRPLNIEFGLKYTTEVSMSDGKTKYVDFKTRKDPFSDKIIEDRDELSYSRGYNSKYDFIVLEDTEENRFFLENIYSKFLDLNNKLKMYFTDEKKLKELITSGQKLLG